MPAKTPTPRDPKKTNLGSFGSAKTPNERYLFGSETEVFGREGDGYSSGGTNPATMAPSFQQIRPGPTDRDANDPSPVHYSGDNKYGNHRKYF